MKNLNLEEYEKIAIVSDIHANKYALDKFLSILKEEPTIKFILNLGDFLQIGPHPKEVAEVILNDERFINILGNNELMITENLNVKTREDETGHSNWTKEQIGTTLLGKIKKIPTFQFLGLNNKKFLMTHSRIYNEDRSNMWGFPLLFSKKSLSNFIRDYPKDVDFILFGHTHHQLYLHWKNKSFINPGSLGCSIHESMLSYCLLEASEGRFNISLKNEYYDQTNLLEDYRRLEVPDAEFILKNFYGIKS